MTPIEHGANRITLKHMFSFKSDPRACLGTSLRVRSRSILFVCLWKCQYLDRVLISSLRLRGERVSEWSFGFSRAVARERFERSEKNCSRCSPADRRDPSGHFARRTRSKSQRCSDSSLARRSLRPTSDTCIDCAERGKGSPDLCRRRARNVSAALDVGERTERRTSSFHSRAIHLKTQRRTKSEERAQQAAQLSRDRDSHRAFRPPHSDSRRASISASRSFSPRKSAKRTKKKSPSECIAEVHRCVGRKSSPWSSSFCCLFHLSFFHSFCLCARLMVVCCLFVCLLIYLLTQSVCRNSLADDDLL